MMVDETAIDVFISSTCYDLIDLRAELRRYLEANGLIVRISDDFDSGFAVDPTVGAIQSCLLNVERAKAVICIIDRRYGPPLPDGEWKGISATHAEIIRATNSGKAVFTFIRDRAFQDYEQLRSNPSYNAKWVDEKHRNEWRKFVCDRVSFSANPTYSNWFDQFTTISDLKEKILKRLLTEYPEHRSSLALRPDRLVRLFFVFRGHHARGSGILRGTFRNGGVGPAINVRFGFCVNNSDVVVGAQGGLAEADELFDFTHTQPQAFFFHIPVGDDGSSRAIFCEYENRFRDCYRVETLLERVGNDFEPSIERFFTGHKGNDPIEWTEVA